MKKLIVMCGVLLALGAGRNAWAGDNDESPDEDPEFDCPDGMFPMEGSSTTCVKLAADECPEGWTENNPEYDGDPGTCTCESGVTEADGSCNLEGNSDNDGVVEPGEPGWPWGDPWDWEQSDCGAGYTGIEYDTIHQDCPQDPVTPYIDSCRRWTCIKDCPPGSHRDGDIWSPCITNDCDLPWPNTPEVCTRSHLTCGNECDESPYLQLSLCTIVPNHPVCDDLDGAVLDDGESIRWVRGFVVDRPTVIAEYDYPDENPCWERGELVDSGTCKPACEVHNDLPCVDEALWIFDQWTTTRMRAPQP